jgi:hypothetical protein
MKLKKNGQTEDGDNLPGCGWWGKFYFDRELPVFCPRCNFRETPGYNNGPAKPFGQILKIESLVEKVPYDIRDDRRRAITNW